MSATDKSGSTIDAIRIALCAAVKENMIPVDGLKDTFRPKDAHRRVTVVYGQGNPLRLEGSHDEIQLSLSLGLLIVTMTPRSERHYIPWGNVVEILMSTA
jgi:hypothetical protein